MDTSTRAREEEKSIVLGDWIEALDDLGIDTTKALQEEHGLLDQQRTLHQHYLRFRDDQNKGLTAAASNVMKTAGDYDSFASTLATAAIATDTSIVERAQQIAALARESTSQSAFNHFRRRGEGTYDIIRGVFEETRDAIIRDGGNIPDGVVDLDTAARAGVESEWLRLEALVERWDNILQLIESWYINGVFAIDGRNLENYNPWMFVFADYQQAIETYGVGILTTVRQVINCDTRLLTITEVDELESTKAKKATPDEQRAAHWRQRQADDEATAILRAEWEANGISPRLVAVSAKRSR
ncbi:hypothetical protein NY537_01130 [Curtobacterium flaccumfaciens pv. betae]|uniref:hypothetical protein n=1 Tax=Curtobacterium flaccumfaciens TaxID=2035 RepID=UPI0026596BA7|nr:hypothetical protein [Curtobacterium flaccumfaciens]MCS5511345.1 hypothetical protein [Curtobacterium flaccumfaciens pv. betae]